MKFTSPSMSDPGGGGFTHVAHVEIYLPSALAARDEDVESLLEVFEQIQKTYTRLEPGIDAPSILKVDPPYMTLALTGASHIVEPTFAEAFRQTCESLGAVYQLKNLGWKDAE